MTGAIIWDSMKIDCPEHVCVKSDVYCNQEQMGDGICHDNNNSILCDYDLGDCCVPDTVENSCCLCLCTIIYQYTPTYYGFFNDKTPDCVDRFTCTYLKNHSIDNLDIQTNTA